MPGNWYNLGAENVIKKLGSGENGLSEKEAKKRLEKYGLNKLVEERRPSVLRLFFSQFTSFLIIILILAGIVSFLIGESINAIAIFVIIIINAILGFVQEYKAEKAIEALKKMTALKARVIREGILKEIDSKLLVPGDLIILDTGDKVPADVRLSESINLRVDEAVLTGESNPVGKNIEEIAGELPISDRKNLAFANTIVTYGRGKGIVVETGMQTEFGKIAGMIKEIKEEETPLRKRLEVLAKQMGIGIIIIVLVLFGIGIVRGIEAYEMFMVSVSLGVSAIPEGLPAVITITLALGILQMARNNALVRKMPSVEALGSATVICSDKTGTITRNEMVVEKIYVNNKLIDVSGKGYEPTGEFLFEGKGINPLKEKALELLLQIGAECNNAVLSREKKLHSILGDPTEGALIVAAEKAGLKNSLKRIGEIPFSSERKMMTTINEKAKGRRAAYSKGALEEILSICEFIYEDKGVKRLSEAKRKELINKEEMLAKKAYRVLAFAFKELGKEEKDGEIEKGMVFVGLAAMRDPPRKDVKMAIALCKSAGIKVKIITGDNALTASAIAEKIGLEGKAINGKGIEGLKKEELKKIIQETTIFARASAEHKYKIISILQEIGEVVAVTGDGVNDAPALKKADIGVAMGIKGTDVAKEASDIVLRDDDFSTILVAIKEGRRIYANIKNFIKYLLSVNFSEIVLISFTSIFFLPLPLLPLQILWLNIATDSLPALALGRESSEPGIMNKPPRNPKEGILARTKTFLLIATIIAATTTFIGYLYGMHQDNLAGIDLNDFDVPSKARTIALSVSVIFELLFVFNCRVENKSALELNPFSNKALVGAVLISFLLHCSMVYFLPFAATFLGAPGLNALAFVPLSLLDWIIVIALAALCLLVPYFERALKKIKI